MQDRRDVEKEEHSYAWKKKCYIHTLTYTDTNTYTYTKNYESVNLYENFDLDACALSKNHAGIHVYMYTNWPFRMKRICSSPQTHAYVPCKNHADVNEYTYMNQ